MLTKEAFNALLKTLEEPPSTVKFFFATTEPHKVLPTITSRCQRFDLHRLTTDQIVAKLQQISVDMGASVEKPALELMAHVAEGGLRDAESLLDQLLCYASGHLTYEEAAQILGISPRSMFFKLDHAIESYNLSFAFELASELFSTGKDLSTFLDGLIEHYRTILLLKFNLPLASYLHEKERGEYAHATSFYTQEHCLYILDYLIHWMKEIHRTPFKRITLEMILLHLIRSQKRVSLPTLVRRLEELESGAPPSRPLDKPAPAPKIESKPVEPLKKVEPTPTLQPSVEAKPVQPIKAAETPKAEAPAPQLEPRPIEAAAAPQLSVETLNMTEASPTSKTPTAPKIEPTSDLPKPQNQQLDRSEKNRYDTLLRFAAVELEGSLKKGNIEIWVADFQNSKNKPDSLKLNMKKCAMTCAP